MSYAGVMHLIAFDPGPTWTGWCRLYVEHNPGVRCTFREGGYVPTTRADLVRVLVGQIGHAPDYESAVTTGVAIERPRGYAFGPGRLPMLLDTAYAAGGISWVAEGIGHKVVECTAQQVRKVIAGKANADDREVRAVVEGNIFGAGGASNEHVRDACAVGLIGAWVLAGQVVLPEVNDGRKGRKRKGDGAAAAPGKRARGARAAGEGGGPVQQARGR